MKKILNFINTIKPDKLKHDFVGSLLTLMFIPCIALGWHTVIAYLACWLVAGGYELYQKYTGSGDPDLGDMLFTIKNPSIVFLITLLYQ